MKSCNNAFAMRRSRLKYVAATIIAATIYIVLSERNWAWYSSKETTVCKTPEGEMKDLVSLAHDTREILQKLNMTYFLIYGSLWGALRVQSPLEWDNDFDIGLVYSEVKTRPGLEERLLHEFQKKNIKIHYRLWFGTYRVVRDSARGDLMVYRRNWFENCVRLGIESWVFFLNYRKYHTFPCYLIEKPLPYLPFSHVNFTVPRQGVEIQKHFYPNDWWVESKPSGC